MIYDVIAIQETAAGITFAVKVQARARRNAISGEVGSALKVSLTAPPIDGRANEACIAFFAELLGLPRSSVSIITGLASRNKVIRVSGVSLDEVRARLGIKA